jgi:hypothetical protein
MSADPKNNSDSLNSNLPAGTGNASNPSPQNEETETGSNDQLLSNKAEKYLREAGNIEDMPDAEDEQEMDKVSEKVNQ